MAENVEIPSLYGIKNSNRDFSNRYFWGKNQFNSSFPVALCCYMRDMKYGAVLISQRREKTVISEVDFDYVFGTDLPNEQLKFCFESAFLPYSKFAEDDIGVIDLVVRNNQTNEFIRPLEIKLTTLPDDCTSSFDESCYGSEIVVRSPTMRYLVLGLANRCSNADRDLIKSIFHDACKDIRDWENRAEMLRHRESIFGCLDVFLKEFERYQSPLLLQPIWKTLVKEPRLAENCLDVFVWTDIALARAVWDVATSARKDNKITRSQRSLLRLARFLYEFAKSGSVYQKPIYDGMTFDTLNDKEFSLNGNTTNPYMKCQRLVKPIVRKSEIRRIILGGGQRFLSPERRFDAILYFSTELFK